MIISWIGHEGLEEGLIRAIERDNGIMRRMFFYLKENGKPDEKEIAALRKTYLKSVTTGEGKELRGWPQILSKMKAAIREGAKDIHFETMYITVSYVPNGRKKQQVKDDYDFEAQITTRIAFEGAGDPLGGGSLRHRRNCAWY